MPFSLTGTRNDCTFAAHTFQAVPDTSYPCRRARVPCVVRHPLRLHTHQGQVLHRPPRKVHALEVSTPPPLSYPRETNRARARRQTVFYTPDTITVSEGQKITGQLSCAPNGRNPRDLDIAITYEAEGEPAKEIQYKMCVIPSFLQLPASGCGRGAGRTLTVCQVVIHFARFCRRVASLLVCAMASCNSVASGRVAWRRQVLRGMHAECRRGDPEERGAGGPMHGGMHRTPPVLQYTCRSVMSTKVAFVWPDVRVVASYK